MLENVTVDGETDMITLPGSSTIIYVDRYDCPNGHTVFVCDTADVVASEKDENSGDNPIGNIGWKGN